ncbi:MAG: COX15/CtaA family protein [Chloroflexi bacterium]|nr:COX15/CtaA family protein [Chloroflexota bacterium]MCI0579733.1 COX15/CtaA family protein [Chloroflexota bacterium]MCI0644245.1 COX15/CtaA family protein [Chloroflexota bacterium]MCI0727564.1 COX15/CtaA family protein [Chloroflexota bacterium]
MNTTYKEISSIRVTGQSQSKWATLALTGLVSTILLIGVGSFVRVSGNGLGCPDWPLCYGRAVPPLQLGAWIEFSHRLLGGIVGLQIFVLAWLAWRGRHQQPRLWGLAAAAVGVFFLQASLGGIHVLAELPYWSGFIHTAVAMALAGLLAALVAATQPGLRRLSAQVAPLVGGGRLPLYAALAAGLTYLLLVSGSLVTRSGASLACPAFPQCGVAGVPPHLEGLITIQMAHRLLAFVVAVAIGLVAWRLLRLGRAAAGLRGFGYGLAALVVVQFSLGISNVLLALPMWSRVLHLMTGGTIWVLMVILAMCLRGRRDTL